MRLSAAGVLVFAGLYLVVRRNDPKELAENAVNACKMKPGGEAKSRQATGGEGDGEKPRRSTQMLSAVGVTECMHLHGRMREGTRPHRRPLTVGPLSCGTATFPSSARSASEKKKERLKINSPRFLNVSSRGCVERMATFE